MVVLPDPGTSADRMMVNLPTPMMRAWAMSARTGISWAAWVQRSVKGMVVLLWMGHTARNRWLVDMEPSVPIHNAGDRGT